MTAFSDETGRDAFVAALASLAAAISLLERTPRSKKAAASDKMFDQMIVDYKKALEEGRAALSASPVGEPALRLCGYCKTWNSKPCGEQCYLSPSDPVAWQMRKLSAAAWFNWIDISVAEARYWQAKITRGETSVELRGLYPGSPPATPAGVEEDWRDDPSADERWQAGLDYGMERFCSMLGVDPKDVRWDAATEELDGDVCAVIGNILRVKFGDDFDPEKPLSLASFSKTRT